MSFERILFPTKFRELSFNALESLFPLRDAGLKEIVLCHVISRDDVGFVPFGGYMKEEEEKLKEEARIRFEDWQKSITEQGIKSSIDIRVGQPVPQILHAIEDVKADMVIVGKKQTGGIQIPFAGSHTLELITRTTIPALVSKYMVRYEVEGEEHEKKNDRVFERPMLVTDWSEPSHRALEALKSLHAVTEEAIVFHDMEVNQVKKEDLDDLGSVKKVHMEKLETFCDELKGTGVACETHLGAGKILDEILRVSRDRKATIIILGTSGKGWLSSLIHGSISQELVKSSELPTMLVP